MMGNTCLIFSIYLHIFTVVFSQTKLIDPHKCKEDACCAGYFMRGNICTVCQNGTHGLNCSEVCLDGYFGRRCQSKCAPSCELPCNKSTGVCSEESSLSNKLKHFLQENALFIASVSSVIGFLLLGCAGIMFFRSVCRKSEPVQPKGETTSRGAVSGSARQGTSIHHGSYENSTDGERSNASKHVSVRTNKNVKRSEEPDSKTSAYLQNNDHDVALESASGQGGSVSHTENPRPRCRYSLAKTFVMSEEFDFCQEFSDDNDVFDTDVKVYENSINVENRFDTEKQNDNYYLLKSV
ncbi:uncharacterized protein LOC125664494 [Ostrea edulis]|uniref:uncharacterized protein LOC125664494 n=1 Tax=Ostrea edulis TaxID=37623 RepID=UPI0024AEBB9B|nr:uncharacterized protein LOC125664494 [Ostrea edulis]